MGVFVRSAAIAMCACSMIAGTASTAWGFPKVLTVGALGGVEAGFNDAVSSGLAAGEAKFETPTGNISCTNSAFEGNVSGNPETGGGEAHTATVNLTKWTFGMCKNTVNGLGETTEVKAANILWVMRITDSPGLPVLLFKPNGEVVFEIKLKGPLGVAECFFGKLEVGGSYENAGNKLRFVKAPLSKIAGGMLCPASASFSATYGTVTDTTAGGAVFVN